jgi:hypothetical protein
VIVDGSPKSIRRVLRNLGGVFAGIADPVFLRMDFPSMSFSHHRYTHAAEPYLPLFEIKVSGDGSQ